VLPGLDVIERTKLDSEAKIAAASETASLRARNLEGAMLIGAELRKVDFTGTNLRGAFLDKADLRDAKLDCALPFREGSQDNREPVLCVQLKGASLIETQLQGASLNGAQLQGASLYGAQLQGASLNGAQFQGASLNGAYMWRLDSKNIDLTNAQISWPRIEQVVSCDEPMANFVCAWTPQRFHELRDKINHEVPDGHGRKKLALDRIDQQLDPEKSFPDVERMESWRAVSNAPPSTSAYEAEVAKQWQQAGCAVEGSPYVASRLIARMTSDISPFAANSPHSAQLAGAFLAETCKGARGLSEREIATLENLSVLHPPKSP